MDRGIKPAFSMPSCQHDDDRRHFLFNVLDNSCSATFTIHDIVQLQYTLSQTVKRIYFIYLFIEIDDSIMPIADFTAGTFRRFRIPHSAVRSATYLFYRPFR